MSDDLDGPMWCTMCESRTAVLGSLCVPCVRNAAKQLEPHGPASPTSVSEHMTRQVIIDVPRLSAELAELQSRIRATQSLVSIRPAERVTPTDMFAAHAVTAIMAAITDSSSGGSVTINGTYISTNDVMPYSVAEAAYKIADALAAEKATRDAKGDE